VVVAMTMATGRDVCGCVEVVALQCKHASWRPGAGGGSSGIGVQGVVCRTGGGSGGGESEGGTGTVLGGQVL
jgi:hypothetical protein